MAGACTAIAGSSDWFERGFVTYSNAAKTDQLGVPVALLAQHGAVSQAVAEAMVQGTLTHAPVDWAVAVTGIAGPGGAVPGKPVGTVWLAWGRAGQIRSTRLQLPGDRTAVRLQTVKAALQVLHEELMQAPAAPSPSATAQPSPAPLHVLFTGRFDAGERERWWAELRRAAPHVMWMDVEQARAAPELVHAAVVARPPPGALQGWPGLRLIQSLWAGVDRLLADPSLPHDVPLARMVDPMMTRAMAETAVWAALSLQRGFFSDAQQQGAGRWQVHEQRRAEALPVLVLGQGVMGTAVTDALRLQGYPVSGWRRRDGRDALLAALPQAHIVINVLPLTDETRGLIGAPMLRALPRGAGLVNLARGAHVVDSDLLAALDDGHIGHAVLDVFHIEPLPPEHRFWRHPRVTVLPHVAALTDERSAAAVVVENLRRLQAGEPLLHTVDRKRGY